MFDQEPRSSFDYETEVGGAPAMSDSDALELEAAVSAHVYGVGSDPGLGLLLELARRGEYDPWDVDIVALTDRYLAAMDEHLDARNLGQVARLIFYAAALIHLKAQALAAREAQRQAAAAQQLLLDEALLDDALAGGEFPRLRPDDRPLLYPDFMGGDRRGGISLAPRERPARNRGVTLVDLIVALRSYDERLAEREAQEEAEPLFDGAIALEECVGSSHQDELDRDLVDVRQELWQRLEEGGSLALDSLVTPQRNKAAAYLALLFLAQDEEVVLTQREFYGELRVERGPYFGEVRAGVWSEVEPQPAAASEDEAQAVEEGQVEVEEQWDALAEDEADASDEVDEVDEASAPVAEEQDDAEESWDCLPGEGEDEEVDA